MTNEQAKKMLKAKLECLKAQETKRGIVLMRKIYE